MKDIKTLVLKNSQLTIKDIDHIVSISKGSVISFLMNFGPQRNQILILSKAHNCFENERRINVCETMLSDWNDIKSIITSHLLRYVFDPKAID